MIDESLARRLIERQFPQWAGLPVGRVDLDGWDNRTFRLGAELSVRLPSGEAYAQQVEKEQRWLPVLAPQLPLPIPVPVARGEPDDEFPYPWSVYRWLEGRPAALSPPADDVAFAGALAAFLRALARVDASGGPPPGTHNFFRGAHVSVYAEETEAAIAALGSEIDGDAARRVWDDAMRTSRDREPVWFHGDVAVGNLLVRDGRLGGVIDFGSSGVGDPACDTVIAWTFFTGAARDTFRARLGVEPATWSRGRGWALWKSLITLVGDLERDDAAAAATRRTEIARVIADYDRGR